MRAKQMGMNAIGQGLQQSPTPVPGQAPSVNNLLGEYMNEIERLREENNQIRFSKDLRERDFENAMFENA